MKAEMSQGRHAAQGEIDGLGRVAAAGSLTQAATANCVSNNADPVGRQDAWQKLCGLNETVLDFFNFSRGQ